MEVEEADTPVLEQQNHSELEPHCHELRRVDAQEAPQEACREEINTHIDVALPGNSCLHIEVLIALVLLACCHQDGT